MGGDRVILPGEINWQDAALDRAVSASLLHPNASFAEIEARHRGSLCYLATPYSKLTANKEDGWSADRSQDTGMMAAEIAGYLASHGITAVSPIVQADVMVRTVGTEWLDPLDATFWTQWCAPLLQACSAVIVPRMTGWQENSGIWHEVRTALSCNRPVYILEALE